AMTYAVAIGVATAQLRKRGKDLVQRLWTAVHDRRHQRLVRELEKEEHYVQLCIEELGKLLRSVDPEEQFTGLLDDIINLPERPSGQHIIEHFEAFRKLGSSPIRSDISQVNSRLYDLVSAIFGYWPKYSLGFLEDSEDRCVRFDSNEIGDLVLDAEQF